MVRTMTGTTGCGSGATRLARIVAATIDAIPAAKVNSTAQRARRPRHVSLICSSLVWDIKPCLHKSGRYRPQSIPHW